VAPLRLGTSAVHVTSDMPVTELDWPPEADLRRISGAVIFLFS
jgi:hypothetical protein